MGPSAQPLTSPPAQGVQIQNFDPPPSSARVLAPVLEPNQLQALKQSFVMGGALESPTTIVGLDRFKDNSLSFRSLERKLRKLGESIGTLGEEELGDAVKEIEHLETIEKQLFILSQLKIDDPTLDAMRHDCATKLLADVNNPLGAGDYQEGNKLLTALVRCATTGKGPEEARKVVAELYPGGLDSGYVFSLNFEDALDRETDPTRKIDKRTFEDLDVIKAYRTFKNSSDENDQKVALAVETLFSNFKDGGVSDGRFLLNPSADTLNAVLDDRQNAMNNPDLKPFFARLQELKGENVEIDYNAKLSNDVSESLRNFKDFSDLTKLLYGEDKDKILSHRPADKVRDALLMNCSALLKKGPEYVKYLRENGHLELAKTLEDRLQEDVLGQQSSLNHMEGKDLNTLNVANAAGSLAPIASIFRDVEEMKLKKALFDKLVCVNGRVGVGDLQERLEEITPEAMEDPSERLKAYRDIVKTMDKRSIKFVAEERVKQLTAMKQPVAGFFDTLLAAGPVLGMGGMDGSFAMPVQLADGAAFRSQVVNPRLNEYDVMIEAYRHASELMGSDDPAKFSEGVHEFQRLEASKTTWKLNDLKEGAEDAATANQVTAVSVMVLASIAAAEMAPFIGIGARGLVGLLPIELGTQGLVTAGVTFATTGLLMTGVQREVSGILMPGADQGNFFEQWVFNTATMGVGAAGAKLGEGAFAKALTWMAERRIAARMGTEITVAGSSTGSAIEASVLNAEKESILQGLTAKFSQTAAVFGAEFTAIQVFEYVKTVGLLHDMGVENPEKAAFSHVFSLKSLGTMAGFMVVMKAHGLTSVPESDAAITDLAMKTEYSAIARSLNRELPKFKEALKAAGLMNDEGVVLEPERLLDHPDLLQKAKTLLSLQTDMLAFKSRLNPTDTAVVDELTATVRIRDTADPVYKYIDGVEAVFGDSNSFGVLPKNKNSDGIWTSYTYQKGNQGKIVSKLRNLPGVDSANVRISPNGYIEIPFLSSPFMPAMTIRMMPALP